MAVYYECPSCKAHNAEHQKYCVDCGAWLLSTTYPAKQVDTKKRSRKTSGPIITLLIIGFLVYLGWSNQGSLPAIGGSHNITFDKIKIEESYSIDQLIVNTQKQSATADFTAIEELRDPVEISTVYYDASGNRLGTASALVIKPLAADQTTTVTFKFSEVNDLSGIAQVRVEVTPLSPLMLLERAANMEIPQ